jgi:hypothetical protein
MVLMNRETFTIEDHLAHKDATIVSLYRRLVQLVEACGPFTYVVGKAAIASKGKRRNFAVAKPKAHWLDGVLVLPYIVKDARFRSAPAYTKQLYGNQFRVNHMVQLDEEFAEWVYQAYQIGQGQH